MRKVKFCVLIALLSGSFNMVWAQRSIDVSVAAGDGFSPAIAFQNLYGVGAKKKLKLGWGIRSTSYFSGKQEFITAPAKLTSGKQSIMAFFTEYKNEKLDTMYVDNARTVNLNTMFVVNYDFGSKFGLGFNIDLFGVTFGGKGKGKFQASESQTLNNTMQSLKPTPFNILLISDSDIGSLNSELFAKWQLNDKFGLKAGLSFQFVEYKAEKKLTFDNDRFRHKALMPVVGVNIKL